MTKKILQVVIAPLIRVDILWVLLESTVLRITRYAERERRRLLKPKVELAKIKKQIETAMMFSPTLSVKNGPFKGMRYPEGKAIGSAFISKILGSYEKEIHPFIDRICKTEYTEIINVGCAEGYYTVGLAMRLPNAKVFAFDTNTEAIRLLKQLGEANNVSERIETGSFCDPEILMNIPVKERALIVSDCEGYEKELFTEETANFLRCHDLLIEVHDHLDIGISSHLRNVFEKTHIIEVANSLSVTRMLQQYNYPELKDLDLQTRKYILDENRPPMDWFFMTATGANFQ